MGLSRVAAPTGLTPARTSYRESRPLMDVSTVAPLAEEECPVADESVCPDVSTAATDSVEESRTLEEAAGEAEELLSNSVSRLSLEGLDDVQQQDSGLHALKNRIQNSR